MGKFTTTLAILLTAAQLCSAKLVIKTYGTNIYLIDQAPVYESKIALINEGTSNENLFQIALPTDQIELLSRVQAEDGFGNKLKSYFEENIVNLKVNGEDKEFKFLSVEFSEPLTSQRELTLGLVMTFFGDYQFLPKTVDLFEDQKVVYWAMSVPTVPYAVETSRTQMLQGNNESPMVVSDVQNLEPLSFELKKFHFALNKHIEVSHWGNVKFTETYDMVNRAANFTGHFSTLDFNKRNHHVGRNAFRMSHIKLPYNAWGFSYRDELGNISTSLATHDDVGNFASVYLTPRYALLGGWNSTWEIGYNVPTQDILMQNLKGTEFVFEYDLAQTVTEGNSDLFEVRVALPEGAKILSVETGSVVPHHESREERTFSYLDFLGRPTVLLHFKNHIPQTVKDEKIRIRYSFSKTNLMIEPAYLIAGLMGLFSLSIVASRLNLDFKAE